MTDYKRTILMIEELTDKMNDLDRSARENSEKLRVLNRDLIIAASFLFGAIVIAMVRF